MEDLENPLPYREACYITKTLRALSRRRHEVAVSELTQVPIDQMLWLCYSHPSIEKTEKNKAVLMCIAHDIEELTAMDERIPDRPHRREFETNLTIYHLECQLRVTNPGLASVFYNIWTEYVKGESNVAKLVREVKAFTLLQRAYRHERQENVLYDPTYVESLCSSIDSDWLQNFTDFLLTEWRILKEIQNTGPIIFVYGGPCSGKTLLCARIAYNYDYEHVSLASMLDEEEENPDSPYADIIAHCRDWDAPVPSCLAITLLKNKIRRTVDRGILIDGFPETVSEVRKYEEEISARYATIFLDCPLQTMVDRIQHLSRASSQPLDAPEAMQDRIEDFMATMTEVLAHVSRNPVEHIFSGVNSEDRVFASAERIIR